MTVVTKAVEQEQAQSWSDAHTICPEVSSICRPRGQQAPDGQPKTSNGKQQNIIEKFFKSHKSIEIHYVPGLEESI